MTTDEHNQITKGQLVLLTEGAYSDFRVVGLFRALQDFNMVEVMRAWRKAVNPDARKYGDQLDGFAALLVSEKFLVDVDYSEQDLGAYNEFDRGELHINRAIQREGVK